MSNTDHIGSSAESVSSLGDVSDMLVEASQQLALLSELFAFNWDAGGYPMLQREEVRCGLCRQLQGLESTLMRLSGMVLEIGDGN